MSTEQPDEIGPYVVIGELGHGTFAEVFRVRADDGGELALKRNLIDDTTHRERLRNEIRVLRQLDHPGIPRYVAAGGPEEPYVVMNLAPGETLSATITAKGESGSVHGDIETLQVLHGLLDILAHLAKRKVVHRDVKAGNVMATPSASRVSLIDFGFSKADGTSKIRMDDSFFRAGAIRYSPPRKIENPGVADASHDVFAAGVLAYRMLTGVYPWSVSSSSDLGVYREHIATHSPIPVHDRNPLVRADVSSLIMALIRTDDARRPTAAAAAREAATLLKGTPRGIAARRPERVAYPHVSRDPLYGDVRLTQFEWELMQTPQMQRLRDIKQLGTTNYVFLGAEHSRLSHCVGSLQRVEQILSTIEDIEGVGVDLSTRLVARAYALVHDVTHVSFGHTVEDELGIFTSHDDNFARITRLVLDSSSELNLKLKEDEIGRAVIEHFDQEATVQARTGIRDLVAGSTGADILDYVNRDAYYCGLDHRIDSAIFRQFRWLRDEDGAEPRLISLLYGSEGLRLDREYAVESLLLERYAMFLKVYTNKTKTAASALLGKALTASLIAPGRGRPDMTESEYEWFADAEVLSRLLGSRKALPRELAAELKRGSLPRGVYRAQLLGSDDRNRQAYEARQHQLRDDGFTAPEHRAELENDLARKARLDSSQVILYCPTKAPGFQRVSHVVAESGRRPHVLDPSGVTFRQIERKHLALWELWVFIREPTKDHDAELASAIEERIGLPNLMAQDRRADRLW
jgi:HD superfamily phosphohydrolase